MNLDEHIRENEDVVAALMAALAAGDEAAYEPLLQRRGSALAALDEALRTAPADVRGALQPRLETLVARDQTLRTAAGTALAAAGEALRTQRATGPRGPAASETPCRPACLDQRA